MALLRKKAGLSQQDVAEKLNVSRSLVGQIEKDLTKPNLEFLTGFVRLVNTTYELLLENKEISEDELLAFEFDREDFNERFIKRIDEAIFNTILDIAWDKVQNKSAPNIDELLIKNLKEVDVISRIILRGDLSEGQIASSIRIHVDRFLAYKGIKPLPSRNPSDRKR